MTMTTTDDNDDNIVNIILKIFRMVGPFAYQHISRKIDQMMIVILIMPMITDDCDDDGD